MIAVTTANSITALGPEWDPTFEASPGVQTKRLWFEATEAAALPARTTPAYLLATEAGRPLALLPMQTGPHRPCTLTTLYTTEFQPLMAPEADPAAIGQALGRHLRRYPVTMFEALDPAWPGLKPFLAGLRRAGLVPNRFNHFGNWHERVAGLDWTAYLAGRPGALRETIRRRTRTATRDGTVTYELLDDANGLEPALEAYEAIYARSWKVPEPFPAFNPTLLPKLAEAGVLRMAVMRQAGRPIAAQYWTVHNGVATVLKLAHDDAARPLSPGSLLTAHIIRHLLEHEWVHELDFGRGDDPYKQSWVGARRQRIGIMLANPRRPAGLLALARHELGRALRKRRAPQAGSPSNASDEEPEG